MLLADCGVNGCIIDQGWGAGRSKPLTDTGFNPRPWIADLAERNSSVARAFQSAVDDLSQNGPSG